jgi:acetylornithine deacetylase/succinyl-diaminopimelate desuccinylase-like protein
MTGDCAAIVEVVSLVLKGEEQEKVVFEVTGDEEVMADMLAAVVAEPAGISGIGQ